MTAGALLQPSLGVARPALISEIRGVLGETPLAIMLYGSQARGTATPTSDLDVLAVVAGQPGSFNSGTLSISAYRQSHFESMARRGSLFILHLLHDGQILCDSTGVLAQALSEYRPPADPENLRREMSAAAYGLSQATPSEREAHGPAMLALAFYVLRTVIYDTCASRGAPEFEMAAALSRLRLEKLIPMFARRREAFSVDLLDEALSAVVEFLRIPRTKKATGLAAVAVTVAQERPLASDLLSGVIAGGPVNYTGLTLPPG